MLNNRSIQDQTPEEYIYSANNYNNVLVNEMEGMDQNKKVIMNKTVVKNAPTLNSSPRMKASTHITQRKKILESRRAKMNTSNNSHVK